MSKEYSLYLAAQQRMLALQELNNPESVDPETGELKEEVFSYLQATEENVQEVLYACKLQKDSNKAAVDSLKAEIARLRSRIKTYENSNSRLTTAMVAAMKQFATDKTKAGNPKLATNHYSMVLMESKKAAVAVPPSMLPEEYIRQEISIAGLSQQQAEKLAVKLTAACIEYNRDYVADNAAIKQAIKEGQQIEGVDVVVTESVRVY